MHAFSIIIPAYNEAGRITATLESIKRYISANPTHKVEVLVVDDGSTDQTAAVVTKMTSHFPELRLVQQKPNQGKGAAVTKGMLEATQPWRLMFDADGSTPITELDSLLVFAGQPTESDPSRCYEVIIGSRYLHSDSIKTKQSVVRRIVSRLGNRVIQSLVVPGVIDTQCGFKLFSERAVQAIFPELTVKGWLFDVEVLTIAHSRQFAIKEVPVEWHDATESKLRTTSTIIRSLRELKQIKVNQKKGVYA